MGARVDMPVLCGNDRLIIGQGIGLQITGDLIGDLRPARRSE